MKKLNKTELDFMEKYKAEQINRKKVFDDAVGELMAVVKKYFPEEEHIVGGEKHLIKKNDLLAPKIFATVYDYFSFDDGNNPVQLYLEWFIEHFILMKVTDGIHYNDEVHNICKQNKFYMHRQFEYNDMDNHVFIIKNDKYEITCYKQQSWNYFVLKDDNSLRTNYHIRLYYSPWDRYEHFGKMKEYLRLKHFMKGEWELHKIEGLNYLDQRDEGYIISFSVGKKMPGLEFDILFNNRNSGLSWDGLSALKSAFFNMNSTWCELTDYMKRKNES